MPAFCCRVRYGKLHLEERESISFSTLHQTSTLVSCFIARVLRCTFLKPFWRSKVFQERFSYDLQLVFRMIIRHVSKWKSQGFETLYTKFVSKKCFVFLSSISGMLDCATAGNGKVKSFMHINTGAYSTVFGVCAYGGFMRSLQDATLSPFSKPLPHPRLCQGLCQSQSIRSSVITNVFPMVV